MNTLSNAGWMGLVEELAGVEVGYGPGQLAPENIARWPTGLIEELTARGQQLAVAGKASLTSLRQTTAARTVTYALTVRPSDVERAAALAIYADIVVMREPFFLYVGSADHLEGLQRFKAELVSMARLFARLRPLLAAGALAFCSEPPVWTRASVDNALGSALSVADDDFEASDGKNPANYRDWLRAELVRGGSWMDLLGGHVIDVTRRAFAIRELRSTSILEVQRLTTLARCPFPSLDQVGAAELATLRANSAAFADVRQIMGQLLGGIPADLNGAEAASFLRAYAKEQLPPVLDRLAQDARIFKGVVATSSLIGAVVAGGQLAATGNVSAAAAAGAALGPVPLLADALHTRKAREGARLERRVLMGFVGDSSGSPATP